MNMRSKVNTTKKKNSFELKMERVRTKSEQVIIFSSTNCILPWMIDMNEREKKSAWCCATEWSPFQKIDINIYDNIWFVVCLATFIVILSVRLSRECNYFFLFFCSTGLLGFLVDPNAIIGMTFVNEEHNHNQRMWLATSTAVAQPRRVQSKEANMFFFIRLSSSVCYALARSKIHSQVHLLC